MKKFTFYTLEKNGEKKLFHEIVLDPHSNGKHFKQAVSLLKAKSRDIADFLHIKGNHLYFWNLRISW